MDRLLPATGAGGEKTMLDHVAQRESLGPQQLSHVAFVWARAAVAIAIATANERSNIIPRK